MEVILKPTWLPEFKGNDLSVADCEALAAQLEPGLFAGQWDVHDTIWFDYVRLHPVKALYYFVHEYGNAFGRYMGQNLNHDMRFSRGLKGDILKHREIRSILALKREADKRGIPYPIWINGLFAHFAARGWTRPPRPSHMLNCEEAITEVEEKWGEALLHIIMDSNDPWFQTEAWTAHPHQIRHENWLVQLIKLRTHPEFSLANALYDKGNLRIERAILDFPREVLDQAFAWHHRNVSHS